jgi:hypothetical protein
MPEWIPTFTLPNITLTETIESQGIALVSTADPRLAEICNSYPAFAKYVASFKTEFGRSVAPSFILCHQDTPPSFKTVDALAAFRDAVSMSVIPYSWARSLRHGGPFGGIFYSNWFHIYPWTMDKNYEHLVTLTLATHAMDEVTRLVGQSSPAFSPRHLDMNAVDQTLLAALLERWQRSYRAEMPAHDDVALFRSLNMANSAALLPAGPEATMYDIGRSVALWVSAFEILAPAKHQGYAAIYDLLRKVEYEISELSGDTYQAYGFSQSNRLEPLTCWVYGEIYHARNDFLHGNPITPKRLFVEKSDRALSSYTAPLYRLALTGLLDLTWRKPWPPKEDAQAFGKAISDRMDFKHCQVEIERAIATVNRRPPDSPVPSAIRTL